MTQSKYPVTPDGRYFVVKGRLWRMSNPALAPSLRQQLVQQLMKARRDIVKAHRTCDRDMELDARARVNRAKVDLGERGPVWWNEEEGDYNQRLVMNSPYAAWFNRLMTQNSA